MEEKMKQCKKKNNEKTSSKIKVIKIITVIIVIGIIAGITMYLWPILKNLTTPGGSEAFKEKIQNSGLAGFFMLMGLQLAQIIIAILPGEPLEVIAGMCYGSVGGTLFILFSTFISSLIIFFAVRKFGKKLVYEFFNKEKVDKIEKSKLFNDPKKIERILLILFFIPGTPKDLITYIAGILPVDPVKFILIATFGRIPSIVSSTIAGASLIEGSWQISILSYGVTFLIVGIISILYKILAKDTDAEEAMKSLK